MKINTEDIKVIFEYTPRGYFLVHDDHRKRGKEWALCPRIDRSEKGKSYDVAPAEIFIDDEDAEQLKKAGFTFVIL